MIKIKSLILIVLVLTPYAHANHNQFEVINNPVLNLSENYSRTSPSDNLLIEECKRWNLNKKVIDKIFKISEQYEHSPYREFNQTPCDIVGRAKLNNEIWDFHINGGGITTFTNDDKIIYLGCNTKECEPFFIIPYDGMDP
ncbi:hypothetical protein J8V57_17760 [Xenorhabdus sp. PB61.4]|uniref:hypothetical protein n=1 Tax=Xenorhabdus sp. PB61.4 TaxID=2788940 RepID=UPI001E4392BF|nr:hypothetical protein [Xenorhabdus sp. PB61.4]MCC8368083.1 hypothetical protein [Xenorhabdus sp. PB61.4]